MVKFAVTVVLLFLAAPALLFPAYLRLRKPFEFIHVYPSARDFWIDFDEARGGQLRHPSGAAWPLEDYQGEGGRLWKIRPPGIDRTFLVLRLYAGASSAHSIVWHCRSDVDLEPVAELFGVGEMLGNSEGELLSLMFQDVDGDGIEELREPRRGYVRNETNDELDGWAIETVYHRWNGSAFVPKWTRMLAFDVLGPLAPAD